MPQPTSEAYAFDPLDFEDTPRGDVAPDGAAPQRIASTLRAAGIDAPSSLYDEALALARDGHLGQAVSRLHMLLCLDPDDGDALLLLSRVNSAQGRSSEALAKLDAAVAAGVVAPPGFRDLLESQLYADRNREEEHRNRVAAREQGELKGLRQETRQLRTDNQRLEMEVQETLKRERIWKLSTIGIALFSTGTVLALMILPPITPAAEVLTATPIVENPAVSPADIPLDPPAAEIQQPPAAAPVAAPPVAAKPSAPVLKPVKKPTAAPSAEPVVAGKGQVYTVQPKDNLGKIALKAYGDASKWQRIQDANADVLKGGVALKVGMKLKIP
jgi:nucleoid-associated protein YgaU